MIQTLILRQICLLILFFVLPSIAKSSNKIVAIVNDEIITQNQLNQTLHIVAQQAKAEGKSLNAIALRKEALQQLIDNKLLLQVAKQNHINATDAEVNQHIKMITTQNHLTLDQFKKALQKEGSHFKTYLEFIKNQITLSKLRSQFLGSKVKVSEQDIHAELAQAKPLNPNAPIQLLDILITPAQGNDMSDALATAKQLKQQLLKEKNLQASIQAVSNSKIQILTKELGWKTMADLPDLFAKAVKTLPAGQITSPLSAPNGIHLLAVMNRQGGKGPFTREEAENIALHKKMQTEVAKWLGDLKKQAYIDIKE